MADKKPIELEEGWASMQVHSTPACMHGMRELVAYHSGSVALQQGINKLIRLLEGEQESQFNAEQYMMLYT